MKLIMAIVTKEDTSGAIKALVTAGFMCTKLATFGGFLRQGNITLLIGTEDEKVDTVIQILTRQCAKRTEMIDPILGAPEQVHFPPVTVPITAGGATVFVVDVEKFLKL